MTPETTGRLPTALADGVERLSGVAVGDVRVHFNSQEPSRVRALAFARGSDIHVAPGQERHLPHEAWHVVQQRQGRARPTAQLKGETLCEHGELEREADEMGARAARAGSTGGAWTGEVGVAPTRSKSAPWSSGVEVIQREPEPEPTSSAGSSSTEGSSPILKKLLEGYSATLHTLADRGTDFMALSLELARLRAEGEREGVPDFVDLINRTKRLFADVFKRPPPTIEELLTTPEERDAFDMEVVRRHAGEAFKKETTKMTEATRRAKSAFWTKPVRAAEREVRKLRSKKAHEKLAALGSEVGLGAVDSMSTRAEANAMISVDKLISPVAARYSELVLRSYDVFWNPDTVTQLFQSILRPHQLTRIEERRAMVRAGGSTSSASAS